MPKAIKRKRGFWGPGPERFRQRKPSTATPAQQTLNLVKAVVFTPLLIGAAILDSLFE